MTRFPTYSSMPLAILLGACEGGSVELGSDGAVDDLEAQHSGDAAPEQIDTGDGESDTAEVSDDSGGDDEGDDDTWPKDCADVYDPADLPTFELDFGGNGWSRLESLCASGSQEYVPVDFTWNGETVAANVRLKGNWTWNCGKMQFVVSFNEDDPEGRFHGLRKIVLDAPWYDRTLLQERLAHPLFSRLGLPYSCANNARVEVNGEYYGLYANLERLDREYLERHFENPDGNLYQAGSELKTNEDVNDTSDLAALHAAATVEEIAALVDLDEATAEWAAEAMIPALDNYWAGVEINYYLYHHPDRGFLYLPYDLDLVFGTSVYSDGSPIWSGVVEADPITWEHTGWRKEQLFQTVLADRAWCEVYVEKLVLARAAYDPAEMAAQLREWDEQILDAYADDPRKVVSVGYHEASVDALADFLQDRADFVDGWLAEGGHCPARW